MGYQSFFNVFKEGKFSKQAHCDLPENSFEREVGHEGFFGPSTHMYHENPPVFWEEFSGPLRPRLFNIKALNKAMNMPYESIKVLHNKHVTLRYFSSNSEMKFLYRNADGDELFFIHEGVADFFSDYGHLVLRKGDYLLIPRGTMWRLLIKEPLKAISFEATNEHFRLPEKGLVGQHAIFDTGLLEHPSINDIFLAEQKTSSIRYVKIKRLNQISTVRFSFYPLDALGWKGSICPLRINVADIRPLMSHRFHLPPSAHTTFLTKRFVICTFVPRPIESDKGALKVPFFHNNDDFEEVIFYHDGDFFSRDNISPGMLTYHPFGFTHGPHPKALKKSLTEPKSFTDEIAVMLDARDPLEVNEEIFCTEDKEYVNSWKNK